MEKVGVGNADASPPTFNLGDCNTLNLFCTGTAGLTSSTLVEDVTLRGLIMSFTLAPRAAVAVEPVGGADDTAVGGASLLVLTSIAESETAGEPVRVLA